MIPKVEETLKRSADAASSLKSLTLPTKPVHTTSSLVGKAYMAAGQAGAYLHTMAVLQAYQTNLNEGQGVGPNTIKELSRATDLCLCVNKETAHVRPSPVVERFQEEKKQSAPFWKFIPCCQRPRCPAICAQLFKSTTAKREHCGLYPHSENLVDKTMLSHESKAREDRSEECSSLKEASGKRP